ncbi:hypothetical protein CDQ84_04435 [Clostridium thermosuccinogenes]|uniref:Uncharacterized protein n=1 Tax=Clostridium thermosuccinogenes TaxID=84032 RepID=A0A2K2FIS2_9CLOT|nr:hypothetical protein CDO33_06445 [Pseudoclostridium thermosuccinogenes]PNT93217.1 hypothetical protein CDQ83_06735 [Pseudoclostridium thermosuccinogenes]PNT98687.1 hypothetical protein CDQ85_04390 [Pseudoclostridium thermosuccinogenes]PNU00686.1 hypothetical protein CDQ84_04435 [Pseudoclostridium thermosuccinogenes]
MSLSLQNYMFDMRISFSGQILFNVNANAVLVDGSSSTLETFLIDIFIWDKNVFLENFIV